MSASGGARAVIAAMVANSMLAEGIHPVYGTYGDGPVHRTRHLARLEDDAVSPYPDSEDQHA